MSEKEHSPGTPAETQSSDVSRETVDLIEIMDRSLPKTPDTPEEETEAETPPQGESTTPPEEKAPPSPPGKNKPSSFYVYLVILFGAAFLMLLLAYFVQRRNNETAISELRSTMNLSREQLLEKIETLEKENESLRQDNELLNIRLGQVKEERENYKQQIDERYYTWNDLNNRVAAENALDHLELFVNAKDWLMAGAIIQNYDFYFSPTVFVSDALPSQAERYLELRETVLGQDIMILERTAITYEANQDSGDETVEYYEQPTFRDGLFEEQDVQTAKRLANLLTWYPTHPEQAANALLMNFPDTDSQDRLNSGAFRPSTVELFEQVKTDLENYLEQNEDGAATGVIRYGEDSATTGVIRYGEGGAVTVIISHPQREAEASPENNDGSTGDVSRETSGE